MRLIDSSMVLSEISLLKANPSLWFRYGRPRLTHLSWKSPAKEGLSSLGSYPTGYSVDCFVERACVVNIIEEFVIWI